MTAPDRKGEATPVPIPDEHAIRISVQRALEAAWQRRGASEKKEMT